MSIVTISNKDIIIANYRYNRLQISIEEKKYKNVKTVNDFLDINKKLEILNKKKELLNNYAAAHSKDKLTKKQYEEFTSNGLNIGSFYYLVTNEEKNNTCVICTLNFEINEEILILHCKHMYHTKCITKWVLHNPTCPYCRCIINTHKQECHMPIINEHNQNPHNHPFQWRGLINYPDPVPVPVPVQSISEECVIS